jgi:hypothetical protein
LGCKKLLLQGIPLFRLQLGNETEVQLGDLAGNAMSLPVVDATMLAGIMSIFHPAVFSQFVLLIIGHLAKKAFS